ncbi:hypothetical protein [Pseudomonas graminis]
MIKRPPALPTSMSPLMQRGAMLGHVLIALKHHCVDKDEILKGMLPASKREITSD